jgi:dTDP-glucose pyrophosphorylase
MKASSAPVVVKPGDALRVAHDRIRADGRGLAVVVGRGGKVAGTVTDGAVRRAVLGGIGLDAPVEQVMSRRPVTSPKRASKRETRALLHRHRLRAVPIVDGGRLVGVRSLDELDEAPPRTPVAVVMVGGRGERLRPLTDAVPKPLLRIGGLSIVERLIQSMAKAGVRDVYLTLNYKADVFEEQLGTGEHLGVSIDYVREKRAMGSAGGLSLLPDGVEGPIVVANGDLVTTIDFTSLLDFHWHHEGAITVTGVEHLSPIPYGVLRTVEHHLLGIDEKPQRSDFVSAGIYVLEPAVLRFVPRDRPSTMPELIDSALAEGLPVHVFPILERWFDIGSPEEFERVLLQFAVGDEG